MSAACAHHATTDVPTASPPPTPLPSGPVFAGAAPARMLVTATPLGLSPDGTARVLVRAAFLDVHGSRTILLGGGDVDFSTTAAYAHVQWQTRMRFDAPAAIVSFDRAARAEVLVRADVGPPLAPARIVVDSTRGVGARAVAAALGPHEVQIGWRPGVAPSSVSVFRNDGRGNRLVGIVAAPAATFRDVSVRPATRYGYSVLLADGPVRMPAIVTPPEARGARLSKLAGKAMWLSFSPSPLDPNAYARLDPAAIVARAAAAGIRAIELRVSYGAFREITPSVRPTIDALLDAAAAREIAIVAWTVPRSTAFEDVAASADMAQYRTRHGTRFAALAVDLERGGEYLGDGATGYAALTDYLPRLRAALGPRYPLVATVEDPYLEHLDERDVPYAEIAASADVLQPMAYWRMLSTHATTPDDVRAALRGSFAATARAAGRRMPIDVGGQTTGDALRGSPSPADLSAAVDEAHRLGAMGMTFFDWDGTSDAQWRALAASPWRPLARRGPR